MIRRRLISLLVPLTLAGFASVGCVKPPIEGRLDPYPVSQIHFASKALRDPGRDLGPDRRRRRLNVAKFPRYYSPARGRQPRASDKNPGRVPKWTNGSDCKSDGLRLRRFESYRAHCIAKTASLAGCLRFRNLTSSPIERVESGTFGKLIVRWCARNRARQHLPNECSRLGGNTI